MSTACNTVTKIFTALTEPELWAKVNQYATDKHATILEYSMDCSSHPNRILSNEGVPACYNITVTYRKEK